MPSILNGTTPSSLAEKLKRSSYSSECPYLAKSPGRGGELRPSHGKSHEPDGPAAASPHPSSEVPAVVDIGGAPGALRAASLCTHPMPRGIERGKAPHGHGPRFAPRSEKAKEERRVASAGSPTLAKLLDE